MSKTKHGAFGVRGRSHEPAFREGLSLNEQARQLKASLFARAVLSPPKVATALRQTHPEALDNFKEWAAFPA